MATVEMGRGGSKSRTKRAVSKQLRGDRAGLQIATRFCPPDTDPFETVEWEIRSAAIKDESGKALFEPSFIHAQSLFTGDLGGAAAPLVVSLLIGVASISIAAGFMGAVGLVGAGILARYVPRYIAKPTPGPGPVDPGEGNRD